MASKVVKRDNFSYNKLLITDVLCPLCREILIKPITLPCNHCYCQSCFENENDPNKCPECGVRVGSWLRTARKRNKMINDTLWKAVQSKFPKEIGKKLIVLGLNASNSNIQGISAKSKDNDKKGTLSKKPPPLDNPETFKSTRKPNKASYINLSQKEYTCRILCKNLECKTDVPCTSIESQIRRRNRQIHKLIESEKADNRSNSIESEYLYFKPIDHRNIPLSESLTPIKVPSQKPSIKTKYKIIPPCGKKINLGTSQSAFALYHKALEKHFEEEVIDMEETPKNSVAIKRNNSTQLRTRKRPKIDKQEKETNKDTSSNSDSPPFKGFVVVNNDKNLCINAETSQEPLREDKVKKAIQEQSDFELAIKLQEQFNQAAKYLTRSAVPKKTKNNKQQMKIGVMKVK